MKDILKLAAPIAFSNMAGLLAVLINTLLLGRLSVNNFYILSLFLPFNFWVISLSESCRVPATAYAAYANNHEKMYLIGAQIWCLIIIVSAALAIPLMMLIYFPTILLKLLSVDNRDLGLFRQFTIDMLLVSFFMITFHILSAVLNGIDKQMLSMKFTLFTLLLSTAVNFIFINYTTLDLFSLPISTLICYSLMLGCTAVFLIKKNVLTIASFKYIFRLSNFVRLMQLACPVWTTYILISLALMVFTYFLAPYSRDVVSGFGIAYRIQTLIMLPAISLGIAIGIIFNKRIKSHALINNRATLCKGMALCILTYGFISAFVFCQGSNVIHIFTNDESIAKAAITYLRIVSFSYIGLGLTLCYCMVLDQTGYGIKSAIFTMLSLFSEIMLALLLLKYWDSPQSTYFAIALGNIWSGFISILLIIFSHPSKFVPKFATN